MRKAFQVLIAVAVSGIIVAAGAQPASAALADAGTIEKQVASVLDRTPGAKRIDRLTIEMKPGVFVTLEDPAAVRKVGAKAAAAGGIADCAFYYLCMWEHSDFVGAKIHFTRCGLGVENLGNMAFPRGGTWSDKVSSIMNNQSSGTWSGFYDWYVGGGWDDLKFLKAFGYWRDLSKDKADDGSKMNDRIDGVQVC
ncbi:peptidase inhibitor family I36 protein [Paractinoplanes toevensis]|uniref:Uncharacterized protein n=1 Tax=Paractinoplanes toevensis TaxID=571911 RepID=A0A919W7U3_9ACTN|nr:peptidase inhibitor family I36 protein [Actinoplanes toevensis]GIM90411.1 hypothetical protein Ato02nite_022040 [Actinoplanes toevensis]